MAAMSHSFRTEVHNTGDGNPSFLSKHLDSLCPASQEEDEWLVQELEKARSQRGTFYKKLANTRAASQRELDDLAASKLRAASRGSTEVSLSPSGSTASPPPAIPEPHCSWRFYTSFDNGEWKRHCVPVYKSEDEILKSPSTENESTGKREKYEHSPAFESHLKKYRQARASLFDRPPSRRTYLGASPRDETATTTRIVSTGNDPLFKKVNFNDPNSGGNRVVTEDMVGNRATGTLPSTVKQEITTSETITTINGDPNITKKSPTSVKESMKESVRLKHHNLGFKEKVIVPTKYKTDAEKEAAAAAAAAKAAKAAAEKENKKPKVQREMDPDHPSFLGSTFEKFNYAGGSLIKPQFGDSNKQRSVFDKHQSQNVKIETSMGSKPMFDDPFSAFKPPNVIKNTTVYESTEKTCSGQPSFNDSGVHISSTFVSPFQTSTPVKMESTERPNSGQRSSLPFQNISGQQQVMYQKPIAERPPDVNVQINGIHKPSDPACIPELGNKECSAFSVPSKSRLSESMAGDEGGGTGSAGEGGGPSRPEGVVFIPVIRVMPPADGSQRTIEAPAGCFPAPGEIISLDEDSNFSPNIAQSCQSSEAQLNPAFRDVNASTVQAIQNSGVTSTSSDGPVGSFTVKIHHNIEGPSSQTEKVVFPSDRNYKSQVDIVPHGGTKVIDPSIQISNFPNTTGIETSLTHRDSPSGHSPANKSPSKKVSSREFTSTDSALGESLNKNTTNGETETPPPPQYNEKGERIIVPSKRFTTSQDRSENNSKQHALIEDQTKQRTPIEDQTRQHTHIEDQAKKRTPIEDQTKKRTPIVDETKQHTHIEEQTKQHTPIEDQAKQQATTEDHTNQQTKIEDRTKDITSPEQKDTTSSEQKTQQFTATGERIIVPSRKWETTESSFGRGFGSSFGGGSGSSFGESGGGISFSSRGGIGSSFGENEGLSGPSLGGGEESSRVVRREWSSGPQPVSGSTSSSRVVKIGRSSRRTPAGGGGWVVERSTRY